ncbi:hypothetical protein CT138_05935 [Mannheimia varigena]|uniref:hypothetical protein n=1 Tax=Mannheimia varigena TaxID=85404 RepID=UPI000DBF0D54|nr:hypothetical protein [Mannheimia varigena]AWW34414.1 hypothetical protein CT138_05935 [Mannheimia varigena]
MEILGNYQHTSVLDKQKISFNTKNYYFNYENKIISNGYGISIDEEFSDIFQILKQGQDIPLNELLEKVANDRKEKVSNLVWQYLT